MTSTHWDKSIVITGLTGKKIVIRNVTEAENYLLSDWHRFEPNALYHAVIACLLTNQDHSTIYNARVAFEMAAQVSGLLTITMTNRSHN